MASFNKKSILSVGGKSLTLIGGGGLEEHPVWTDATIHQF